MSHATVKTRIVTNLKGSLKVMSVSKPLGFENGAARAGSTDFDAALSVQVEA